ncbi:MAG: aminotransferase class III-fold pyridoxal phosphate-dependent enzyme, partial [Microbacteriaceae bacterium]|nr:aminotransferase class III-fold pyridoxal phosphate-dependent enzyme [Microbacteriaceae bacterium]
TPDIMAIAKGIGGGFPLGAVLATEAVAAGMTAGTHGSTFGGNPLAAAIGVRVVQLLAAGTLQKRAQLLGTRLREGIEPLIGHGVTAVRVAGLWAGVDIDPRLGTGRHISEMLLARGLLVKDTHGQTIRLAPPLVIRSTDLDWALEQLHLVIEGEAARADSGQAPTHALG